MFDMHLLSGDMATTIFTTVTITATATPSPTTVLVAAPCTDTPQIITATFTAPKLPDEYPLHLFPPFTQHALPTVTPTTTATTTRIPDKILPFPNGAAPETSDPLGIHSVQWYYGPGPSVLLNLMAIVAILQLHLGPPSQRVRPDESEPTTSKGKLAALLPRLQRGLAKSALLRIPLLYLAILTTLAGINRAAWDLLIEYIKMERLLIGQDAGWVAHAGTMGPPFTMLTWGLAAAVWRVILCLVRIQPKTPARSRRTPSPNAAQRQIQKQCDSARISDHMRLLAFEGIGLVLPTSALGLLCFNKWAWLGGTTVESKWATLIAADYMPALYWDGMGASMHSILVLSIATAALTCVFVAAFTFFGLNGQFFEHCHKWVEKHVCRDPLWKLWLGYWGVIGVEMACCVVFLLAEFVGIGDEWLENNLEAYGLGEYFLTSMIWLAAPWAVVILPTMVAMMLMYLPFITLWYVLRGWVFRVLNVQKSSFFIPYAETSVWEGKQLALVALGLGLVFLSCHQIRQAWIGWVRANALATPMRRRYR